MADDESEHDAKPVDEPDNASDAEEQLEEASDEADELHDAMLVHKLSPTFSTGPPFVQNGYGGYRPLVLV